MAEPIMARDDASSSASSFESSTTASSAASISDSASITSSSLGTTQTLSTAAGSSTPTTSAASEAATTTASGTTDPDLVTASATVSGTALPPGATTLPGSTLTVCTEGRIIEGLAPFCEPENGTTKYTGATYYVTWFPGFFPEGTQVSISLDFVNSSQNAWHSDEVDKNLGFVYLPVDDSMLQGNPTNNLTMSLISNIPDQNEPANRTVGPTIVVSPPEVSHLPPSDPTPFDKTGLSVGLPIAVVALVLIIAVLFVGMRKQRRIGLGNVMGRGRRGQGYGVGKSRRQRLGIGRGGSGGGGAKGHVSALEEFDTAMPGFRDDPNAMAAAAGMERDLGNGGDVELGERKNPAGSGEEQPERYRDAVDTHAYGNGGGNAFREEINRQKRTRG